VAPAPGEPVVYKRGVSALAGTELDRLFRLRDVNTLVLTGVATQFAVEGTAREAVDRGYRVVVLEDCCASRVKEVHQFSIDRILRSLCQVTAADRFIGHLEGERAWCPLFRPQADLYPGLRALTITPVATWSWCSAGMVRRMTWMTSGVNSGYRAAWSIPNGRCPPTQTSANPALWSLPAKTRSAIAPDTHPTQAL
jgi:isochorismatase family protein